MNAFAVLVVASTCAIASAGELPFRQVAAPAEDILSGRVRLPEASACATSSRCELMPVEFVYSRGSGWVFEASVPVARTGGVSIAMLGIDSLPWSVDVRAPGGGIGPIEDAIGAFGGERRGQVLEQDMSGWRVERYDLERAPAGVWDVRVSVPGAKAGERPAAGWMVVRDEAEIALMAHTATLSTVSDAEIGIVAHLYDAERGDPAQVLTGLVREGVVVVETVNGTLRLPLLDDGLHDDGGVGDGVFGARLPRWTVGDVRARVEIRGILAGGATFARTVQLAFPAVERRAVFSGTVQTSLQDAERARIELGALALGPVGQLHVSAEVWGTNSAGELAPVCWLSRMLVPEERGGEWKLPLFLDGRWIDLAGVTAPFALRNVRVQDPDTEVPYDRVEWMPLVLGVLPPNALGALGGALRGKRTITSAMLMAPVPPVPQIDWTDITLQPGLLPQTLLLVHGYCSGGSIWPAADFTQPKTQFLDPNQNRTHDQFAQLLLQAVPARSSFGVVAHSQGGPAALHLYTYYVSGLDRATGTRRIQSVASPYQGTPLASLGAFACGTNNDMTPSGSATWLAGIPTWARAEVWYWTTSDNGSACNFFTGLLLTNPEDGTVEQFRGQLPGAHSMGHVVGWCHTTGMTYPANYTDHARNAGMNTNAAR